MTDTTAFDLTLNVDSAGWNGYTIVPLFQPAGLTLPTGAIAQIRFTMQGPSVEGCYISECYVGHAAASGEAYDFAETPAQVTFDTGSASKSVAANSLVVTDWINFVYNKTSNLLVPMYISTAVDTLRYRTGLSNVNSYYIGGNTASVVNKNPGYGPLSGEMWIVSKIEVRSIDTSKAFAMFY